MDFDNHPVKGVLADMEALVASKCHDYADDANVYSNFEGSARIAGVSVETVFHVMIGIKIERLRQLASGKVANHESLEDTLMDAANYFALWIGYRRQQAAEVYDMTHRDNFETVTKTAAEAIYTEYEQTLDKIEGV